jgi:prevent-host-death family protein
MPNTTKPPPEKPTGSAPVPASDARTRLPELLHRTGVERERIVIARHGRPLCALVPLSDLARLERLPADAGEEPAAAPDTTTNPDPQPKARTTTRAA